MQPNITIIIPVFNEEKYILNCLESVVNSDYLKEKMEVFVIDGISTDKTLQIVKDFSLRYSFIKIFLTNSVMSALFLHGRPRLFRR